VHAKAVAGWPRTCFRVSYDDEFIPGANPKFTLAAPLASAETHILSLNARRRERKSFAFSRRRRAAAPKDARQPTLRPSRTFAILHTARGHGAAQPHIECDLITHTPSTVYTAGAQPRSPVVFE